MTYKITIGIPMKNTFYILVFIVLFTSCKKEAGVGGTGTIKGKILVNDYNGNIFSGNTFNGADYDVYIIYGGTNSYYDDKISSSYDGSFEFRYLRKGDYKIFVYSQDVDGSGSTGNIEPVFSSATLTSNNETVDIGTIEIND
jgi:hypothetical protein